MKLLALVEPSLLEFVSAGDEEYWVGQGGAYAGVDVASAQPATDPDDLYRAIKLDFPDVGEGRDAFVRLIPQILKASVNCWGPGFMSKLYSAPSPIGVVSELVLATLNTNVSVQPIISSMHSDKKATGRSWAAPRPSFCMAQRLTAWSAQVHVYKAAPALSVVEKKTARALASVFDLRGPRAGGMVQQGGSAANLSAMVIARNAMHPSTKEHGCYAIKLVIFTSSHGHYSVEKAAQICGLGRAAVWKVPTDEFGNMRVAELAKLIQQARDAGLSPFMVNATAGTTALGSYDPLQEIGQVCRHERLWFHVDASWGGAVMFSKKHKSKMDGVNLADSVTFNPHKMLKAPVTCSFLLTSDVQVFWKSNTLPAGYLFHADTSASPRISAEADHDARHGDEIESSDSPDAIWDLADMTLQCGRRGDAFKFAMDWQYRGSAYYEQQIDQAFEMAEYMALLVQEHPNLDLVSTVPPPCLQVCFYWAPRGGRARPEDNAKNTPAIAKELVCENFIIDYAPSEDGPYLRAVLNMDTDRSTVRRLVDAIDRVGTRIEASKQ